MKKEDAVSVIRGLMNYEERPDQIGQTEILTTIALILRGALEKPIRVSHDTLAMDVGVNASTVKRALDELRDPAVRWVEKISGKMRGNANGYQVLLERLPVPEEIRRTIVTEPIKRLAIKYAHNVMKPYTTTSFGKKKTRRFTKGNYARIGFKLQWFADRHCGGDIELLRQVVNFAVHDPRYAAQVRRGPHGLSRDFTTILAEVRKQQQEPATAQSTPEAA